MTAIILPDTVIGLKIPVQCCVFMFFLSLNLNIEGWCPCVFSRFNATTDFVHQTAELILKMEFHLFCIATQYLCNTVIVEYKDN